MGSTIQLPKKTEAGKPRISYSQYLLWKEKKSFNLNVEGWKEYIVNYFLGYEFPDKGWGEFGHNVEDYICNKNNPNNCFNSLERKTLDKIKPLGVFQREFEIDFGEFVLFGIIDDSLEDLSWLRDYKTGSENSKEKYYKDDYCQLDFYAMYAIQQTGIIPKLELVIIERKGNVMFSGGREKLSVGSKIWNLDIETNKERLENLKQDLFKTVQEISEYYKIYLKIFKKI